jgi:hypothetical protein
MNDKPTVIIVKNGNALPTIIFLVIILIGGWLYLSGRLNNFQQIAHIPTNSLSAVTRIAEMTITPGPQGKNQMATAIPWRDNYVLGDEKILAEAFSSKLASAGFDFRITSEISDAGLGVYCVQAYVSKLGSTSDQSLPLQVWFFIPGTRYCSMTALFVNLYGGVSQKDLQAAENIVITGVENTPVVDPVNRVVTHTQKADVLIRNIRFGVLTGGIQPGNMAKKTLDDPNNAIRTFIEASRSIWLGDTTFFRSKIDRADTLSFELAQWSAVAPLMPDGTRSRDRLEMLYKLATEYFNNPSPDSANPYPYDNLIQIAEQAAITAGYSGLNQLKVELVMPFPDGDFYYLQRLDTNPTKVIPPDLDVKFADNVYPLISNSIIVGTDWFPKR